MQQQNGHGSIVNTFLNYHANDDFLHPGTASQYRRNFDSQPVKITDIRGQEGRFSLDRNGFEHHHHVSSEKDWNNEERIQTAVYDETSELLKDKTKATRVLPFSHILRRQSWEKAAEVANNSDDLESVGFTVPARFVHVDQSYYGAQQILDDNMVQDADRLSQTRWGIINVWRALSPVPRDPLGVCDGSTVPDSDLVAVRAHLPKQDEKTFANVSKGEGFETWAALASPQHRWYFVSDMKPDEVLFIKCFDSKEDGRVRRSPHSAFVDPATEGNTEPRESIEVRCLVFWEDEKEK